MRYRDLTHFDCPQLQRHYDQFGKKEERSISCTAEMKRHTVIFAEFDRGVVPLGQLKRKYESLKDQADRVALDRLQRSRARTPPFSNKTWIRSYCAFRRFEASACSLIDQRVTVLLSYAYHSRDVRSQCHLNYEAFSAVLLRAKTRPENVEYALSVIDSPRENIEGHRGAWDEVFFFENKGADVHVHAEVAASDAFRHDYYFFMNCGARGPYVSDWSCPFLRRFEQDRSVGIVGTHLSHEIDEHVQTHAFMVPRNVARDTLYPLWRKQPEHGRSLLSQEVVVAYEIRLSQDIKRGGYRLSALSNGTRGQLNPSTQVSDPYTTVFHKYGGDVMRHRQALVDLGRYDVCRDVLLHLYEREIGFANAIPRPTDEPKRHCCTSLNFITYHDNVVEIDVVNQSEGRSREAFERWFQKRWPERQPERTLISISYVERERFRQNVQYVISHLKRIDKGVVKAIIVNGMVHNILTDADDTFALFRRPNTGFDFGAYGFLLKFLRVDTDNPYSFRKFLFLNGGVQGPFVPSWVSSSWLPAFFPPDRRIGLVTTAVTCIHAQDLCVKLGLTRKTPKANSFVFSVTNVHLLRKMIARDVFKQHDTKQSAICEGEYKLSDVIFEAGSTYTLRSMQSAYQQTNWSNEIDSDCNDNEFTARHNKYFGISLSPFETLFHKPEWGDDVPYKERFVRKEEMKRYVSWFSGHRYF